MTDENAADADRIAAGLTREQRNTLRFLNDPMKIPEGSGPRVQSVLIGGSGANDLPFITVMRGGFPRSMNERQMKDHYLELVELGLVHDRWEAWYRQPAWPGSQTTDLGKAVIEIIGA